MNPKFPFLSALLFIALASVAAAAPPTCRILFLQAPESAPKTLHLFDGTSSQEVELPGMNFSKVYRLAEGTRTITLLPGPVTDPKAVPAEAPAAMIPEGTTDFYLLVASDPSNKVAPVRISVVDATASRLKRGQMLWFNLTKKIVAGKIGKANLIVQPQSQAILDEPATGHEDYGVTLVYRNPGDTAIYPLAATTWNHDPRSRSLAFILEVPRSRAPRVMVFPDYREPAAPKEPSR